MPIRHRACCGRSLDIELLQLWQNGHHELLLLLLDPRLCLELPLQVLA